MAGTRLLLTFIFLAELVVLFGIAVYKGLADDWVLVPLLQQGGRSPLQSALQSFPLVSLEPLKLTVQDVNAWRNVLENRNDLYTLLPDSDNLCQNAPEESSSNTAAIDNVPLLCHPPMSANPFQRHSKLNLQLWIQDPQKTNANAWLSRINVALNDLPVSWPCLRHDFAVDLQVFTPPAASLPVKPVPKQVSENVTQTVYHQVDMKHVVDLVSTTTSTASSSSSTEETTVILYNPNVSQQPLHLVDSSGGLSDVLTVTLAESSMEQMHYFAVLNGYENGTFTLSRLIDSVLACQWCLQGLKNAAQYERIAAQQLYMDTRDELQLQHELLTNSSYTVPLVLSVSTTWKQAAESLEQARIAISERNYKTAISIIDYQVLPLLEKLQRDPTLQPPIDFPLDHYAGVFVPLLIPLFLPALIGLVREWKSYKEKSKEAAAKEKQD